MLLMLSIVLLTAGIIMSIPALSDVLSLAKIVFSVRVPLRMHPDLALPRFLIMVPAHDEELLIQSCVRSLNAIDYPTEALDVLVIADNCSDRTAEIARGEGVRCLERSDAVRRGKPWALAWAIERSDLRRYDAVLIVDADTVVDPGIARAFAERRPLSERAIQGFYSVRNPDDGPLTRMAHIMGVALYNYMLPLRARAGLNVPLAGNGMCIGSRILEDRGWQAFSIAEDTELYVDLTRAGYRIDVEPRAVVFSQEAKSMRQSRTQRQRWRAGRIQILRTTGLKVLSSRMGFHQRLDMIGELLVPGPTVQLGSSALLAGAALAIHPPALGFVIAVLALPVLRMAIYTGLALASEPQPLRNLSAFGSLPMYVLWRMAAELPAWRKENATAWIRTMRHADTDTREGGRGL